MLQANGSFEMVPFRLPQAILVSKEDTDALRLLVFVHLVLCMNCRLVNALHREKSPVSDISSGSLRTVRGSGPTSDLRLQVVC